MQADGREVGVKTQIQTFRQPRLALTPPEGKQREYELFQWQAQGLEGAYSSPLCHRRARGDGWFLVLTWLSPPTAPWGWVLSEHPVTCPWGPGCNIVGVA